MIYVRMFCLCSLLGVFQGHVLYLRSFRVYFCIWLKECSNFIDLHVTVQLSNITCWRDCLFSIVYSCLLCWRLIDCRCMSLFLGPLCCSIDLCLFLWQHDVALITIALQYCLKYERVMSPTLFFSLRITLANWGSYVSI